MTKTEFDQDCYEKDLALILLETLTKSNTIGVATYRAAKRRICGKEVPNECTGTAERTAENIV